MEINRMLLVTCERTILKPGECRIQYEDVYILSLSDLCCRLLLVHGLSVFTVIYLLWAEITWLCESFFILLVRLWLVLTTEQNISYGGLSYYLCSLHTAGSFSCLKMFQSCVKAFTHWHLNSCLLPLMLSVQPPRFCCQYFKLMSLYVYLVPCFQRDFIF